jgi:hypothetical protein
MQKWLNDLYTQILKNGFNPGGGGGGGGSHSGGGQGVLVGKYLGDTYTDTQKQAIANGTFEGLNIGDYWTFNGVNYRIADFDYYYNVGDTAFTKHHIVVVPDTTLYDAQMNATVTTGPSGYTSSDMFTTNMNNARTAFYNAFGESYIPVHRARYISSASGGLPEASNWRDMRVELMGENQVYGNITWVFSERVGNDVGTQKTQFRLFSLDKTKINIRQSYWLTNIRSSGKYIYVGTYGDLDSSNADVSHGVRPFACIVGDPD